MSGSRVLGRLQKRDFWENILSIDKVPLMFQLKIYFCWTLFLCHTDSFIRSNLSAKYSWRNFRYFILFLLIFPSSSLLIFFFLVHNIIYVYMWMHGCSFWLFPLFYVMYLLVVFPAISRKINFCFFFFFVYIEIIVMCRAKCFCIETVTNLLLMCPNFFNSNILNNQKHEVTFCLMSGIN